APKPPVEAAVATAAAPQPGTENKPAANDAKAGQPEAVAEQLAVLEQAGHYRGTLSNRGAAPQHWVLLSPQYKEDDPRASNKTAQPIDLVRTQAPRLPLALSFPASGFPLGEGATWVEQPRG